MSNDLTYYERQKLAWLLRTSQSLRAITKVMRRDVGALSREIRRNGGNRNIYRADVAERRCERRTHQCHRGKLDKYPALKIYVEEKLAEGWSPEQIAGRLKIAPPPTLAGLTVSHESIYYYVYEKAERWKQLYRELRTRRSKRRAHGKRHSKKAHIPGRISIHNRPAIIAAKERFGDWESDTVEFMRKKQNPYLSVQYERKSQLVRIHRMDRKTAEETKEAIVATAESVPPALFKTVTFDNGTENVLHREIADYYGVETYFCDPFASWQKGGVENMNKLLRQYLPRKTDLRSVRPDELKQIEQRLNNRPRKGLGYQTPNEVIRKVLQ